MDNQIRTGELAKIANVSVPTVSLYFKQHNDGISREGNRIVGISPEAVEGFLKRYQPKLYNGAIILSANLCGGVGKTTGIVNLAASARRLIDRKTPIIINDADSQGSLTSQVYGQMANEQEPILIDYLEERAKLKDILTELPNNIWVIKSNLNNASIEKLITKPSDIKSKMLGFYNELFDLFGGNIKIFQDHHPDLSVLFASSVCALNQINRDIVKSVLVPLRSDNFAIAGGQKIVQEINELNDTFSFRNSVSIHCYFSNMDRRIPTSSAALQTAASKEEIVKHLSSVVIRYSDEIPKSLHNLSNVYAVGKKSKATEDFDDLLLSIFR
jgi:cellulose biosynthesis protein BcsQ